MISIDIWIVCQVFKKENRPICAFTDQKEAKKFIKGSPDVEYFIDKVGLYSKD